jgi:hypothetical protein
MGVSMMFPFDDSWSLSVGPLVDVRADEKDVLSVVKEREFIKVMVGREKRPPEYLNESSSSLSRRI